MKNNWREVLKVRSWKEKTACTYTFDYYGSYPEKRIPQMISNTNMQGHITLKRVKDTGFEYKVTLWADNIENLQKYLEMYHKDELKGENLSLRVKYE